MFIDERELDNIIKRNFSEFIEIPDTSAFLKKRGAEKSYRGRIHLEKSDVNFVIGIPSKFPLKQPLFFLEPYDSIGFLPHVEPDGFICFIQDQNLLLDHTNPEGVLNECFERTRKTLIAGMKGENAGDFLREFETYWDRNARKEKDYFCFVHCGDELKKISIGINSDFRIITETDTDLASISQRFKVRNSGRVANGIYIPIKAGLVTKPPKYDEFWTIEVIRELVFGSVNRVDLETILPKKGDRDQYVILGLPDHEGNRQLAGIKIRCKTKPFQQPLLTSDSRFATTPFGLERIDGNTIVPRGGGNISLLSKSILVVGAGSLGGCVALNLAKSGVGKLTIYDPQIFKRENIYRHILGLSSIGKSKVAGLKEYLEAQIPTIRVEAHATSIENIEPKSLSNFDLIIVATGNSTVNLWLNKAIRSQTPKDAGIIFTWVEPYGIGGHALLSWTSSPGCYSCLFDDEFYNRSSFCSKDQPKAFTKSISGCAGLFVPFSFIDSVRTAEIVTRLAVRSLNMKVNPQIISWKGDASVFENEGFTLSNRYKEFSEEEMLRNKSEFILPSCSIC